MKTMPRRSFMAIATTIALASTAFFAQGEEEKPTRSSEMLASHDTIATFSGITFHRCMGRTARCPDDCGHSGNLASFAIVHYLDYQKPGKYGDTKAEVFSFMTEDNKGNAKISAELLKQVKTLTKGDLVRLSWNHDYVTTISGNGKFTSKSPERPVKQLVKLTRAEAEELKKKAMVKAPDLIVTGSVPATLNSFDGIAHVMVYEYHPMLADAAATLIDSKDIPLTHVRGTATALKAVFATIETQEQRKYYTVVNVYSDKGKTTRIMGTGEFGKIFTKGPGETRALKLVPVKK